MKELGDWVSRLMDTGLVHTFGFNRCWAVLGKEMGIESAATWARPGAIPTAEEIERLFQADMASMDLAKAVDVPVKIWSRELVPVKSDPSVRMPNNPGEISLQSLRTATLMVPVRSGQHVEMQLAADAQQPGVFFVTPRDFLDDVSSLSRQRIRMPSSRAASCK